MKREEFNNMKPGDVDTIVEVKDGDVYYYPSDIRSYWVAEQDLSDGTMLLFSCDGSDDAVSPLEAVTDMVYSHNIKEGK